jgi:hypothetical protein
MGTPVPDPTDWAAWQGWADDAALQAQWTGNTNALNFATMPRFHRTTTNFTDEVHEYFFDGVLVNAPDDPDRWPSPSSIHVWPDFDSAAASLRSARATLEKILRECLFPRPPPGPNTPKDPAPLEKAPVLWEALLGRARVISDLAQVGERFAGAFRLGKPTTEAQQEAIDNLVLGVGASGEAWAALPAAERADYDTLQRAAVAALAEDFRSKWDDTRNAGSVKHEGYDLYVQHKPVPEHIKLPLGFKRAMALLTKKYDVYGSEIPIADEIARVIGCFDLLLVDRETGELIVADFKNCGTDDLADSGGREYGCHPFTKHLKGTKYNKYRFQVSFYRHILELHYFPGRMSKTCILININPADPDCCQIHYLEAVDMAPFWKYLLQRLDPSKPKGQQQNNDLIFKEQVPTLVPVFPDDDLRCKGRTTRARLPRLGPKGEDLSAGMVWTQNACKSKGFPEKAKSDWAHPETKWFGKAPPGVAESYEIYLLNSPKLLLRLRGEIVGKQVACWCFDDALTRCNGEVLVKVANLLDNGAFDLCFLETLSQIELNVFEETQRSRMTAAKAAVVAANTPATGAEGKRKKAGPGKFRNSPPGELAFVCLGKDMGLD